MGRDTESGSEVFQEDNSDLKSIGHNFSSLSGSVSNICWVNIKVRNVLNSLNVIIKQLTLTRERTLTIIRQMMIKK